MFLVLFCGYGRKGATELLDTCEELGLDEANVRKGASKKYAKRKAVPLWSVPTEVLIMALSLGYFSTEEQERTGVGRPPICERLKSSLLLKR